MHGLSAVCALGRTGITRRKREGDGATPVARLHALGVLFRADRLRRPATALPVRAIRADDGWCDEPSDRNYNRPVRLPFAASHEVLKRLDAVYDIVVMLDWNHRPRRPNRGSAIFLHLARADFAPTAGCVAVTLPVMRRLLAAIDTRTVFEIG